MATVSVSEAPAVGGLLLYLPVVGSVGMILDRFGLFAVALAVAVVWMLL
jgi:hypothetical protein